MKSGFVALVGRPNVGKSTLLNRLVGRKLAITSDKPQTTRHRIAAVLHLEREDAQIVFLDTPGFQRPRDELGAYMQRVVRQALEAIDAVGFVVDGTGPPGAGDRRVAHSLARAGAPVFLVVNKIDGLAATVADAVASVPPADAGRGRPTRIPAGAGDRDGGARRAESERPPSGGSEGRSAALHHQDDAISRASGSTLAERLAQYAALGEFAGCFPVSALYGDGVETLLPALVAALPEGPPYFPPDVVTDRPEEFLMAELVREQVFALTRDEVPHATTVEVERVEPRPGGQLYVAGTIYVERESQKGIVIGREGRMLREIGSAARLGIEGVLGSPVYLDLHVKVKEGWRKRPGSLQTLGYRLD